MSNPENEPTKPSITPNYLVIDSGTPETTDDELTGIDRLERDLQNYNRLSSHNYFVGCLCGDAVQELIDVYGPSTVSTALDKITSHKLPLDARSSLYWLVKAVSEIAYPDQKFSQTSAGIISNVAAQLRANQAKYQRRLEAGQVDPEEARFQLNYGYDRRDGYEVKMAFVERTAKQLSIPNAAVSLATIAGAALPFPLEPSSIGIAVEVGGFDKTRFVSDLAEHDNDMFASYFANKHFLHDEYVDMSQRASDELGDIKAEIVDIFSSDSGATRVDALVPILIRLTRLKQVCKYLFGDDTGVSKLIESIVRSSSHHTANT